MARRWPRPPLGYLCPEKLLACVSVERKRRWITRKALRRLGIRAIANYAQKHLQLQARCKRRLGPADAVDGHHGPGL